MGQHIKYMGSSHVHLLEKGEVFGGRLATGLAKEVRWNQSNNWIVDTEDAELTAEQVEMILQDDEFKDVTDLERIPVNDHQRIFQAMQDATEHRSDVAVLRDADRAAAAPEEESAPEGESKPDGSEPATGTTVTDDTPATTTGGSTRSTRRGG